MENSAITFAIVAASRDLRPDARDDATIAKVHSVCSVASKRSLRDDVLTSRECLRNVLLVPGIEHQNRKELIGIVAFAPSMLISKMLEILIPEYAFTLDPGARHVFLEESVEPGSHPDAQRNIEALLRHS